MLQEGVTQKQIAENLGTTYGALRSWMSKNRKRYGVLPNMIGHQTHVDKGPLPDVYVSSLTHNEWSKKYCIHSWETDYIDEMTIKLWNNYRIMVFLPRGTGKSFRVISLVCRYILEVRKPVLIITSARNSKIRLYNGIRNILTSEVVMNDYGNPFKAYAGGNHCTILLKDEHIQDADIDPVLKVASRYEDIIGSHPTWIHLEDIIQEEFKSDESNDGLLNWYKGVVSFCATHEEGKETRITATGTRKAKKDFYHYLEEDLKYPNFTLKAIKKIEGEYPSIEDVIEHPNGTQNITLDKGVYEHIGCPSLPLEAILLTKVLMPTYFRTQLQNEPVDPEGNYFQAKHWYEKDWKYSPDSQFIIAIDPAFGKSTASDNTAIIVMAREKNKKGQYIIVEVFAERIGYEKIVDVLKAIHDRYPNSVVKVVCEQNFLQKILIIDKLNQQLPFEVSPFTSKGEKIMRIQSLADPFMSRRISIWNQAPGRGHLFDEFCAFIPKPSTASRKDDALDATHMAYESWVRMEGSSMPSSGRTSSKFKARERAQVYSKFRKR